MRLKLSARKAFLSFNPDIQFYNRLSLFNSQDITAFTFRFHHRHAYSISSGRVTEHPPTWVLKAEWALSSWNERKEPFWWSCVSKKELATYKKLPRSWMARRVRSAVVESLRKKGFNPDGTSVDGTEKDLYGTAQFLAEAAGLKLPYAEIVKQTDVAIEKILKAFQAQNKKYPSRKMEPTYGGNRETGFHQRSKGQSVNSTSNRNLSYKKVQKPREERCGRLVDEV